MQDDPVALSRAVHRIKTLVEDDQEDILSRGETAASDLDFDWIILALLIIFHRLILLGAIHWFAVHRAAQENLKLSFRAEGTFLPH